jgi:hypothetical protein
MRERERESERESTHTRRSTPKRIEVRGDVPKRWELGVKL